MMRPRPNAFTLIEILIVVAIIAILAAIAVPNYLESQTRAKVSRAAADMRSVATGLEAYHVDHNKYPPSGTTGAVDGLAHITSPVAYLVSKSLDDVYAGQTAGVPYRQYGYTARDFENFADRSTGRSARWYFITSNGPNLRLDDYRTPVQADDFPGFLNTVYDPTNSVISSGISTAPAAWSTAPAPKPAAGSAAPRAASKLPFGQFRPPTPLTRVGGRATFIDYSRTPSERTERERATWRTGRRTLASP